MTQRPLPSLALRPLARVLLAGVAAGALSSCKDEPAPAATPAADSSETAAAADPLAAATSKKEAAAFTAEIRPTGPLQTGQKGTVEVSVRAKPPYHLNDEYPVKLKLEDVSGVAFDKPLLTKADFELTPEVGKFAVGLTPSQAGSTRVGGTLSMSVCSDANCVIEKVALATDVDVVEGAPGR